MACFLADLDGHGSDHQNGSHVVNESRDDTGEEGQAYSGPLDVGDLLHDHIGHSSGIWLSMNSCTRPMVPPIISRTLKSREEMI